ncbi:hypothetical protein SERLADRAFT_345585 [Serpula lacrymans var. lacrymans S7.9]|uniref:SAM-dependent MTase RsmB/NOP-type domain-containing protein n=1 Tax=Serpula lacrymans var. lacrymans (strain S7.9) TaxID=578457 RepID=F8NGE9_SERL9|nr:uncharacterized protein SERLADRAFT_345585 [Serpula lacrymans var. lacrymans S7.9]EGO29336.1 hypothetical protein SERLADRAFT_345585 [Serpula lacrymans var. lacrymans S7.9]
MNNERFSNYYKAQNIMPDSEWEEFMGALRTPLPTTFRVAGSREIAHALNQTIQDTYVPLLSNAVFEGESVPPPAQIPWYPEGLAWQFNVSKKVLRKSVEFKKFHSFLVFETEVGNISRQEAVSMLPPLLLDVQPHHCVIDMCAAPGSKTAQLLEALHAHDTVTSTSIPPGLLIANDSDYKRAHLLIHQSARLPSPALMVTNLDASIYPILKVPSGNPAGPRTAKKLQDQLLFDRILCDVPCSGDGTLRKNVGIWKHWQPMDGNGLHGLQVRILQRAMRMLKEDGRIVYSTCSLNPVENEAVVAAALNSHKDFELLDVSMQLPQLIRRPGITTWRPTVDRSINTVFDTYEDYTQTLDETQREDSKMLSSHWPPSNTKELNLTRCLRIYPHLQDTGGFFVAVLQRKQSTASPESISTTTACDVEGERKSTPAPSRSQQKSKVADPSFKEMPYTFVASDDPVLQSCIERLKLTSDFPSHNILVRNPDGGAVRSFYVTNPLVKAVVENNDYTRLRLLTCGTKVITKQEAGRGLDTQFRVLGEGLPVVLPYINPESIMTSELSTLKTLLEAYYPLCTAFPEPFQSVIEARAGGSHIVRFPSGKWKDSTLTHDLVLPLWKSNVSVTLMIDKKAKRLTYMLMM